MLPAQPNKSLLDGIEVLLALAASESSVGSRELARQLGLEQTRVNRLLKTLAGAGIAAQDHDRRYVPGPGMHVLSAMSLFGSGLVRRAMPTLEALGRFGLIVALGVLWRNQVAYLYHGVPGMKATEALGRVGLFPATRSSIGVALLAHKSAAELESLYPRSSRSIPDFPSRSSFERALARVRTTGVSLLQNQQGETRASAISVPGQAPYAAVALSGRMGKDISEEIDAALLLAAETIANTADRKSVPPEPQKEAK